MTLETSANIKSKSERIQKDNGCLKKTHDNHKPQFQLNVTSPDILLDNLHILSLSEIL